MPNEILQKQGADIVWTSAGGDEVLTLTSLANGDGRMGEEHDFGTPFPIRVRLSLQVDFDAAPDADKVMQIFWSSSEDGINYDGECTGADAAYNSEDDAKRLQVIGVLTTSNDTDPQRTSKVFFLPARFGLPVVFNQSGQVLTNVGTNQIVIVTPLIDEIQ